MAKFYDVVIKGTTMGSGDKVLAENLLKGYIHTIAQKETKPKHIIFYGEGVKLSCIGSAVLDDLQAMAESGVEILSCGTCLDYYELTEDLVVGRSTTMSEVADLFAESDNVVEP